MGTGLSDSATSHNSYVLILELRGLDALSLRPSVLRQYPHLRHAAELEVSSSSLTELLYLRSGAPGPVLRMRLGAGQLAELSVSFELSCGGVGGGVLAACGLCQMNLPKETQCGELVLALISVESSKVLGALTVNAVLAKGNLEYTIPRMPGAQRSVRMKRLRMLDVKEDTESVLMEVCVEKGQNVNDVVEKAVRVASNRRGSTMLCTRCADVAHVLTARCKNLAAVWLGTAKNAKRFGLQAATEMDRETRHVLHVERVAAEEEVYCVPGTMFAREVDEDGETASSHSASSSASASPSSSAASFVKVTSSLRRSGSLRKKRSVNWADPLIIAAPN